MTHEISRRRLLQAAAAVAAATQLPVEWVEHALAASKDGAPTTLDRTIVPPSGDTYAHLMTGPGEPWIAHPLNPVARRRNAKRRPLVAFSQLSDVHITDTESPARVEWMDRYAGQGSCDFFPVGSAWRPQETLSTQTMAAMVAALNQVHLARAAARQLPLSFAVSTGDNIDNQHKNELDWFKKGIVGGTAQATSGNPSVYEGVQSPTWPDDYYWVPQDATSDSYKTQFGFPGESTWRFGVDGFLAAAIAPFSSPPLNHPCKVAFGNHDGLVQGTVSDNALFRAVAVGATKVTGAPLTAGAEPCNFFGAIQQNGDQLFDGPAVPVTPDPNRRLVTRREYLNTLLGHGFSQDNVLSCNAYYFFDTGRFRMIVLDTTNPGGKEDGSIGAQQLAWLDARIREAGNKYVMLFSHHGLHSLTNTVPSTDPDVGTGDPDCYVPDEPRSLAEEVETLLHTHPNVIAWVAGHTHQNRITLRRGANGHMFWDIESAAHVDWPCQSRILEVIDDENVLTIRATMVDHAGPVAHNAIAATTDPVLKLAAVHRELAANDPQVDQAEGAGNREDRNVELTLPKPRL